MAGVPTSGPMMPQIGNLYASPPTQTPWGSLPDPGTGSLNNQSAAPSMTDWQPNGWAQNLWGSIRCPTIPTSPDPHNQTPGHT
jgi:hypothetical protein